MIFAGLDLSKIDVSNLSRRDLSTMYTAFRSKYENGYGSIDHTLVNELIFNLRKYIKINLVDVRLGIFGYADNAKRVSASDMRMAMAVYMLPRDSLFDKEVLPYIEALDSFINIEKIEEIRSRPFRLNNLHELWQELDVEQKKLDITGFWEKSADFLYESVNDQLLKNAYRKLNQIEKKGKEPIDIALKIVHYIEIIDYIEKRMSDLDYRILMDFYYADERNLRSLKNKAKHLLRLNIIMLQDMPNYKTESISKNCSTLLFRAKRIIGNSLALGAPRLPKKATRIMPG
jgi:hypothetical protein